MRGKNLSYKLLAILQKEIATDGKKFSLFVYQDNIPAKRLYEKTGFIVNSYSEDKKEIKGCVFMVKES